MSAGISGVQELAMIVPCFNESQRLSTYYWNSIIKRTINVSWFFVDDGSTDDTFSLLQLLKENNNVEVFRLQSNLGKAEALRMGFLNALNRDFDFVGLIDSDESFNIHEVVELCNTFRTVEAWQGASNLFAAIFLVRGNSNSSSVRPHLIRRYIGSFVSMMNKMIWPQLPRDTQCGFKFFRSTDILKESLGSKFSNSWFFEIELLMRLSKSDHGKLNIKEIPITFCQHIEGSKTNGLNILKTGKQIFIMQIKILVFRLITSYNKFIS
jgi:glycosyltransferase involved in cell wall biosynthesis